MCGRFTFATDPAVLQERFVCDTSALTYTPSYNIAPGQDVVAVINDGTNRAGTLRWGLVPSWARDPSIGNRLINARVETVAEKPSFRQALRKRRCLVLADGFYEWRRTATGKEPMYIRLCSQQPFAFAGLWEVWRDADGTRLATCTLLTTAANDAMQPIHHRMPVILDPGAEAVWIDRRVTDPEVLLPRVTAAPSVPLEAYAVSSAVNAPRNNTPACREPV
jgi:putative SOS response-associated peptidase YedK